VMLPEEIEEAKIIGQWLRSKRSGEKVEFFVPKEGQPHELYRWPPRMQRKPYPR